MSELEDFPIDEGIFTIDCCLTEGRDSVMFKFSESRR